METASARPPLRHSFGWRIFALGALILFLQIPVAQINGLRFERFATRETAYNDIASSWGGPQTAGGPVLTVPLRRPPDRENRNPQIFAAHFLPQELEIAVAVEPEVRYRGIFSLPVYRTVVDMNGFFEEPDFGEWKAPNDEIAWDQATISVPISEPRSIQDEVTLGWDDASIAFEPGTSLGATRWPGIHARVAAKAGAARHRFRLRMSFNGSRSLELLPFGAKTAVSVRSSWRDPSFIGAYLPQAREIGVTGFSARWKISYLGRGYPQSWLDDTVTWRSAGASAFGLTLVPPIDSYTMTARAVKYELLFVFLTFLSFFLLEVLSGVRIHMMQYLLIGAALCLFYLLILAFSEQISFSGAFVTASAIASVLIAAYTAAILKNRARGLATGCVIALQYGYFYELLQNQDYSLLIGSLGLTVILALVMVLTMDIDWSTVPARSAGA